MLVHVRAHVEHSTISSHLSVALIYLGYISADLTLLQSSLASGGAR